MSLGEFGLIGMGYFAAIAVFFIILWYVVQSIGVYLMARNEGVDNAFLAFVPIAKSYILGEVCGPIQILNNKIENTGFVLLIANILVYIPVINVVTSFIYLFIFFVVFYEIIKKHISGQEILLTIVAIILHPFRLPYFIFIYIGLKGREKVEKIEPTGNYENGKVVDVAEKDIKKEK